MELVELERGQGYAESGAKEERRGTVTRQLADERAGFRGGGDYLHSRWDLHLVGDTLTEPYGVMSLHELFHADLDQSTNYGRLLSAYNQLALAAGADSAASRTFTTLREWCRVAHETYATYLSLLSFADPGFDDLGRYVSGRYLDYLRTGQQLTGDLRSRLLRLQVAAACLQLCMQAPVVGIAVDRGIGTFLPRDLPADHRPDTRLRTIGAFVGRPGFWPELLARLPAVRDHPDWAAALRAEDTDEQFRELLGGQDDGLGTAVLDGCYSALAAALAEPPWSLPSLGHAEHRANETQLLEACRAITGERPQTPAGTGTPRNDLSRTGVARRLVLTPVLTVWCCAGRPVGMALRAGSG